MFRDNKFKRQMNAVLKHQDEALKSITCFPSADMGNTTIAETEALLRRASVIRPNPFKAGRRFRKRKRS